MIEKLQRRNEKKKTEMVKNITTAEKKRKMAGIRERGVMKSARTCDKMWRGEIAEKEQGEEDI